MCSSAKRELSISSHLSDYIESEQALRDRVSWCLNTYDNEVWVEVRDMIKIVFERRVGLWRSLEKVETLD